MFQRLLFFARQFCCMTWVRWAFTRSISPQYRAASQASVPNMPLTSASTDARVPKAIGYLKSFPGMTVPDAMKLADFTADEQKCPAKQMWIRRRIKKAAPAISITTPTTSVCVDLSVGGSGGISVLYTHQSTQYASLLGRRWERQQQKGSQELVLMIRR